MRLAIEMAQRGAGSVSPNPLVGCVVVRHDTVRAVGWHALYGGPHAEAVALRDIDRLDEDDVVYVTLEPCAHVGKTPPCADLLINKGARTVVVGCSDPHPSVAGKGISRLRSAGITVVEGVEESACRWLARFFLWHTRTSRPWVTVKVAQSLDGVVGGRDGHQHWITNPESKVIVHHMRSHYDAVLVGSGTVLADNPQLTVREVMGRNPLRVVLDRQGRMPLTSNVVQTARDVQTIVYTSDLASAQWMKSLQNAGVIVVDPSQASAVSLHHVLTDLGQRSITSVLCEAGPTLSTAIIQQELVNELRLHVSPRILGEGTYWRPNGVQASFRLVGAQPVDDDLHITYTSVETK